VRALLRLAALSLVVAAPLRAQVTWPAAAWPTATPAAVGLDARVLDSLDAEIRAGRYGNVDRVLVVRHGKVAFDRRYPRDYAPTGAATCTHCSR
jgi:hypothetical protein